MGLSKFYQDHNQNFWHLTCILGAAQSLPGILAGGILAKEYGQGTAITSICIGNLILWLIGWGVISIAAKKRKNAVQNVEGYLGKIGGTLMALILLVAFLAWYMIGIKSSTIALASLFQPDSEQTLKVLGVLLGLFVAVLAIGGIRVIKQVTVFSFPFLLFFMLCTNIKQGQVSFEGSWGISGIGIITIAAISLPGMVNLPTFFRHSNSLQDSLIALTLITVFDALFQISTVFTGMTMPSEILGLFNQNALVAIFPIAFICILLICLNLVNIYFSSAALQTIVPRLEGPLGYLLVGLIGTIFYVFLQNSFLLLFLENVADNCLTNFGVVLLISFLVAALVKHRSRHFEQSVSFFCWMVGCIVALIFQILNPQSLNLPFLAGIGGSVLAFLLIFFFEETIWSMKKVL